LWNLVKYLPPDLLTIVKRFSGSGFRLWLRQNLGANYTAIPDQICTAPDGRRFHIGPDAVYWSIYHGIEYELEATSVLRQLIRPGDIVVDVGANFGWYTTLLAQTVGEAGRVYALEPVPTVYERLLENLRLNNLQDRVTAVQSAVADTSGIRAIHIFKNLSLACASLSELDKTGYETVSVPAVRLDTYLYGQNIQHVDFLKCDVEGSELMVLKSCSDMLCSASAPIIMVELNEQTSRAFGFHKKDIWDLMMQFGYSHFYSIASVHELRRVRTLTDFERLDLALCAKSDQVQQRLVKSNISVQS